MQLPVFDQIGEAVRSMAPDELGELRFRAHGRGVKVWFDTERAGREHFEAQLVARRHIDGLDGVVLEIGFHAEHRDPADNEAVLQRLTAVADWQDVLGEEAEAGPFLGADGWRRVSEIWPEPDVEEPDFPVEVAMRLVDYVAAIEPARRVGA